MKTILYWGVFLFATFLFSCQNENVSDTQSANNQMIITSGQSFGMCVGSCHQELILKGNDVKLRVLTRPNRGNAGNAVESIYKDSFSETEIKAIYAEIDFTKFQQLKEVYGCPDCADGGTEWIEVQNGETKYKVMFEYGKSVKEIEKLIVLLREKRKSLSEKYVK